MSQVSVPASSSKTSCLYNFHKFKKKKKGLFVTESATFLTGLQQFLLILLNSGEPKKKKKKREIERKRNPVLSKPFESFLFFFPYSN